LQKLLIWLFKRNEKRKENKKKLKKEKGLSFYTAPEVEGPGSRLCLSVEWSHLITARTMVLHSEGSVK